jgi:acyl-CoA thioesterase
MHFNELLGLRITRRHKDGLTLTLPLRPELLNMSGVLHGGVTATLADAAAGLALTEITRRRCTTVELKINFLLPVTGRRVSARSRFLRVGRRLAVSSVDVRDQDKRLAASALVTYAFL